MASARCGMWVGVVSRCDGLGVIASVIAGVQLGSVTATSPAEMRGGHNNLEEGYTHDMHGACYVT